MFELGNGRIVVRKAEPAAYAITGTTIPFNVTRRYWVMLSELAEVVGIPPRELLIEFSSADARKHIKYWPLQTLVFRETGQTVLPEVEYWTREKLMNTIRIESLVEVPVFTFVRPFVRAGWARAVIEECAARKRAKERVTSPA